MMLGMEAFLGGKKAVKTSTSTFSSGVVFYERDLSDFIIFCADNFLRCAQESSLSHPLQSQRGARVILKKIRHKDGFKQWQTLQCRGTRLLQHRMRIVYPGATSVNAYCSLIRSLVHQGADSSPG